MKSFLLGVLKVIWRIIRLTFIVIGSIGTILSILWLLLCIGGLLLNALIGGWKEAFDLSLAPLLISVGIALGFSFLYTLGKFDPENC